MAPSKQSKVTSLSLFLDSVQDQLIGGPSELSEQHLASAYGLTRPAHAHPEPARAGPSFPCPSRFASQAAPANAPHAKQAEIAAGESSPARPVVSSAGSVAVGLDLTSDADQKGSTFTYKPTKPASGTKPVKGKGKGKGKGKAKADGSECSAENCKRNPLCMNYLGQAEWEDSDQAMEAYFSRIKLGSSRVELREPETPVGLRNLGATCYMNSFIQVWFQDWPFRRAVYSCVPPANGDPSDSPLFHLQTLFASLQHSQQAVYDPEPLVKSLRLNAGDQQDAQEFGKLFLDKLVREVQRQTPPGAAPAPIESRFEGRRTYGTRCHSCGNQSERDAAFLELDVTLSPKCKLETQLHKSLKDELLQGDNQYRCDGCGTLSDATRFTRLDTLPPVMHFSLTRFQYDYDANKRVKSRSFIKYPLKLDMAPFLADEPGPVWYELKGVLDHRGAEATSGHYVAKVFDREMGKWFLCNDEYVSPIDDINQPEDEEDGVMGSKARERRAVARDESGGIALRSKDSYMLVYTAAQSQDHEQTTAAPQDAPQPPPAALELVKATDETSLAELAAWTDKKQAAKVRFELEREQRRQVYKNLEVDPDDGEAFLVSSASLAQWIAEPLAKVKKPKKNNDGPIDLTSEEAKPAQADDEQHAQPYDSTEKPRSTTPTLASSSSHDSPEPQTKMILSNEAIICKHGHADLASCGEMKLINRRSVDALKSSGASLAPELLAPRDLCRECVWIAVADQAYRRKHKEDVDAFEEAERENDGNESFISLRWLRDWKREMPTMHRPGELTDPNPTEDEFETDVVCEHGELQPGKGKQLISDAASSHLERVFPGWHRCELNLPCPSCSNAADQAEVEAQLTRELKSRERKVLHSLGDSQQTLHAGLVVPKGLDMFVVPRLWARHWHDWSRATASKPRPGTLDNSPFICEHGKLAIDLDDELAHPLHIALVSRNGWNLLLPAYAAGPEIKLFARPSGQVMSETEICHGCIAQRRKHFTTTKLAVRQLSQDDFARDGSRKRLSSPTSDRGSDVAKSPSVERSEFEFESSGVYTTRRSSRVVSRQMRFSRPVKSIEMAKGDSVLQLKLKIGELIPSAVTLYQRLWFNDCELENEQTVDELGMGEGSLVELYVWKAGDGVSEPEQRSSSSAKSTKRRRAEGFGGTGLATDWDDNPEQRTDELSSVAEAAESEADSMNIDDDAVGDLPDLPGPVSSATPAPSHSPFSQSPAAKKPTAVYQSEVKQASKAGKSRLVNGSGMFEMQELKQMSHSSKRAAAEAAGPASPTKKVDTPFRLSSKPPTASRTASSPRPPSRQPLSPLGPADIDLTNAYGDTDDDDELKQALAASKADGVNLTEAEQLERAIADSKRDAQQTAGREDERDAPVASGSGRPAGVGGARGERECPRCTFINEPGFVACVMCEAPMPP